MAGSLLCARGGVSLLLLGLATQVAAQGHPPYQFQEQAGVLPGPSNLWTESVTAVDADEDGRWDVLFVHANGWAQPGDFAATGTFKLAPMLLLNTGTSGGNPVFVDASTTYLPPTLLMHGKGASVADFDADGHEDLVLSEAFRAPQHLLMKQPDTLVWNEEPARLPDFKINGFAPGVGDLDDDGDIDIVFSDAGPHTFSAPGGKAHLCINDGNGFFTEQAAWINASDKIGAQNAKIFDLDNDFDLDVIVDGKSPATQVYFNNGQAHFTEDDTLVPLGGIGNATYETEWGDLDNDNDLDAAIMSLVFYSEGTGQNLLSETGTLAFTGATDTMAGLPPGEFDDDNEFVFIDSDDDGDLDVITVSLQNPQDKLYVNSGAFGPGFLQFTAGEGFSPIAIKDSSLDMSVADFDGDGDYDAITGQGETSVFQKRYYRNSGPTDSQPPRIGRVEGSPLTIPLAAIPFGGLVRHAWIQDSVWDDGQTFATAELLIDTDKLGETSSSAVAMRHSGGQVWRGVLAPSPASTGLVGMRVSYRVQASDPNGNTSLSDAKRFVICGTESYGPAGSIALGAPDVDPYLGGTFIVTLHGGPPGQPGLLVIATARADLLGGTLLVDPAHVLDFVPLVFDGGGSAAFSAPVPNDEALAGFLLDLQAFALDPSQPHGIAASSNGLEVALCAP